MTNRKRKLLQGEKPGDFEHACEVVEDFLKENGKNLSPEALKKEVSKMVEVMYATGGAAFESDLLRRYAWAYFHLGPNPKGL